MKISSSVIFTTCAFVFVSACSDTTQTNENYENFLIINEVVASEENGLNDWVELKNIGSDDILLSDYSLMDITSTQATNLPAITLKENELFVIEADSGSEVDGILPFGLGSEDTLYLRLNNETVDTLSWESDDVKTGNSFGLYNGDTQTLYPTRESDNILDQLFYDQDVLEMVLEVDSDIWQAITSSTGELDYQTSNVTFNNVLTSNVGLKIKGQQSIDYLSTLESDDAKRHRYNFKLDINEFVSGQKIFGAKKIYLHNGFNDPTMMREVLAFELMRDIGMPAPQTSYIDLSLNINGQVENLGLYYMVEAIDGEFIESRFPEDKSDSGDLYQAIDNAFLNFISTDFADYEAFYELENNDASKLTTEYGRPFINLITAINQSTPLLDYLDVDNVIKYMASNAVISSLDNYLSANPNDFYLYEQRTNASKFSILPWDYNYAFGSYLETCENTDFSILSPTQNDIGDYTLMSAIMQNDSLKTQYLNEINSILVSYFNETAMNQNIEDIRTLIEPFISKSPSLFYTQSIWEDSLTQTVSVSPSITTGEITTNNIIGLSQFIKLRHDNILSQLNNVDSSPTSTSVCGSGL